MNPTGDGTTDYMVLRDLRATHVRRSRVMVLVSSIVIALNFLCWAVFFCDQG